MGHRSRGTWDPWPSAPQPVYSFGDFISVADDEEKEPGSPAQATTKSLHRSSPIPSGVSVASL